MGARKPENDASNGPSVQETVKNKVIHTDFGDVSRLQLNDSRTSLLNNMKQNPVITAIAALCISASLIMLTMHVIAGLQPASFGSISEPSYTFRQWLHHPLYSFTALWSPLIGAVGFALLCWAMLRAKDKNQTPMQEQQMRSTLWSKNKWIPEHMNAAYEIERLIKHRIFARYTRYFLIALCASIAFLLIYLTSIQSSSSGTTGGLSGLINTINSFTPKQLLQGLGVPVIAAVIALLAIVLLFKVFKQKNTSLKYRQLDDEELITLKALLISLRTPPQTETDLEIEAWKQSNEILHERLNGFSGRRDEVRKQKEDEEKNDPSPKMDEILNIVKEFSKDIPSNSDQKK